MRTYTLVLGGLLLAAPAHAGADLSTAKKLAVQVHKSYANIPSKVVNGTKFRAYNATGHVVVEAEKANGTKTSRFFTISESGKPVQLSVATTSTSGRTTSHNRYSMADGSPKLSYQSKSSPGRTDIKSTSGGRSFKDSTFLRSEGGATFIVDPLKK